MKTSVPLMIAVMMAMPLIFPANGAVAVAAETEQPAPGKPEVTLTVLNPQGPIEKRKELAPRLKTLKGKKVAMWLSATRGQTYAGKGAELYDLIAKRLQEKYEGIDIVPYMALPMKFTPEEEVIAAIAKTNPDAVVAGFGG